MNLKTNKKYEEHIKFNYMLFYFTVKEKNFFLD